MKSGNSWTMSLLTCSIPNSVSSCCLHVIKDNIFSWTVRNNGANGFLDIGNEQITPLWIALQNIVERSTHFCCEESRIFSHWYRVPVIYDHSSHLDHLSGHFVFYSFMDFIVSLYLVTTMVGSLQKDPTRINVKNISLDSQGWLGYKIFPPKNTRIKESKVQTSVGQFSLGPWVLTMKPD